MNFNKKASTYASTQASPPIGKPEQQRSCSENQPERFPLRDGKDGSSASEDNCDERNNKNYSVYNRILYIPYFAELSLVVLYQFHLQL